MSKSKRRHEEHEEHANHERWLVSYADMMTLLMVLFIVMFAISQVDQRRFDQLKSGMAAAFGESPSPFQGQNSVMDDDNSPMAAIQPNPAEAAVPQQVNIRQSAESQSQSQSQSQAAQASSQAYAEARAEVDKLEAIRREIRRALAARGYAHDVAMKIDQRGLRISLVSRHIVFRANVADLTARGYRVLDVLAPVLRELPNQLEIDGHTNQVKVKPKYYPTDWELSAARAVTVLRYLAEHGGVGASRMEASAFGHEKPLVNPSLPGSQVLNKRVDIVVMSSASEDTRKLFNQVMNAGKKQS
jgi:chemotaxis protein MotB